MPVIPIMPSINTCMTLTTTTNTTSDSSAMKVPEVNTTQLQALAEVCSSVSGGESLAMPNVAIMNSLVSATKVVTTDTVLNPIVASHSTIPLPGIPVPVSSIGIPVMSMKTDDDDDLGKLCNDFETMEEKTLSDIECGDGDVIKANEMRNSEAEPMPIEDESLPEKAVDIVCENDIDVSDDIKITNNDKSNPDEPMECSTVLPFASPKHNANTDVVMAESVSVCSLVTRRLLM